MNASFSRRDFLASTVLASVVATNVKAAKYINDRVDGPGYVLAGTTKWLLPNFGEVLRSKAHGTPFSLALLCAMAYQESGYRWWSSKFRGTHPPEQVLRLLVLDNVSPRSVFPKDTAAFLADPRFSDLGAGLIAAADATSEAEGGQKSGKLRYGYGLFQNDLQNISSDPWFWRNQAPNEAVGVLGLWGDIEASTDYCLRELKRKFDLTGNVDSAVRAYNGSGPSADVYLKNIKVYESALRKAGI